jgi:tRNA (guanine37-N1)-methyltransferase
MKIDIITCQPDLLTSPFSHSILKRAQEKGLVELNIHDLRNFGLNNYGQIDDYAYGGGAGMVMRCEPLHAILTQVTENSENYQVIYLTPDGETLSQKRSNTLSLEKHLILICGHYKGIDQRIRDLWVDLEVSIGDYVLTGGELAAAVLVDSILRLVPGVISDETSALTDSFQDDLLAPPVYTRPVEFEGKKVPDILLSGHEKKIDEWRFEQAVERTKKLRPDLYEKWERGNK